MKKPCILIDLYKLKELHSGLGEFSLNYGKTLLTKMDLPFDFKFLLPPSFKTSAEFPAPYQLNRAWWYRYWSAYSSKFAAWHSLHQFAAHQPAASVPRILTIHDLNFLLEKKKSKAQKYLKRLQKEVDQSAIITTISAYSKAQIESNIDLKNKSVRLIYNGVRLTEYPQATRPDFIDEKPFFFSIGLFSAKKNFHALLPLIKQFPNMNLIIAGNNNTAYGEELKKKVQQEGLGNNVVFPGKISDNEKYWCYKNAKAFLFPSKAEGFGMPVIEAMKARTPVFALKDTALTEIGGAHVYFWEKEDLIANASFLRQNIRLFESNSSKADSATLYANKFSWEHCIDNYISIYKKII